MSFIEHNKDGLVYMSSDQIAARHAFTTRYGGVSQGDFASLDAFGDVSIGGCGRLLPTRQK